MLTRILIAVVLLAPTVALAESSLYAGQETREIKALSPQEVNDLLQGRGMGLAKAAELNRYPGPAHALEIAAELGLDDRQAAELRMAKTRMAEAARTLGVRIVEQEGALDRLFAKGRADEAVVEQATLEIGRLQGRLRNVHLVAHLETRALLDVEQIRRYDALRGYHTPAGLDDSHTTPGRSGKIHHGG